MPMPSVVAMAPTVVAIMPAAHVPATAPAVADQSNLVHLGSSNASIELLDWHCESGNCQTHCEGRSSNSKFQCFHSILLEGRTRRLMRREKLGSYAVCFSSQLVAAWAIKRIAILQRATKATGTATDYRSPRITDHGLIQCRQGSGRIPVRPLAVVRSVGSMSAFEATADMTGTSRNDRL